MMSETDRRIAIRKWFLDARITQRQIAIEAGVSHQLVTMMMAGLRRNDAVLAVLGKHGFPMNLLNDDEDTDAA
jgi:DNA-binding transcriptional regulator LsrR (DeoR family)